jgi:hypothetical protein
MCHVKCEVAVAVAAKRKKQKARWEEAILRHACPEPLFQVHWQWTTDQRGKAGILSLSRI